MRAVRILILVAAVVVTFGAPSATQAATARVSVTGTSTQANDGSLDADPNEDGNLVAFSSRATNLVTDSNGVTDVFVRDRLASMTTRVSVSTAGVQANDFSDSSALSDDGWHVVYRSFATNLVGFDTNGVWDIYARNRQAGTTTMVSLTTANGLANGDSEQPSISDNGRYVAFTSVASNLAALATDVGYDVFLRDRDTDADGIFDEGGAVSTTLVSVDGTGTSSGNHFSFAPQISGNGRYVSFISYASDLGPSDTNGLSDVYVRDVQAGPTVRVSESSAGAEGDTDSYPGGISDNGRYVAFRSYATNLVSGDTNGMDDIFLRDRDTDGDGIFDEAGAVSTTRVSVSTAGAEADGPSNEAAISGDGLLVLFRSHATNLVSGDTNGTGDMFVRNVLNGRTTRVSIDSSGNQSDGDSSQPVVSGNGCAMVFGSVATNLAPSDTNGDADVFLYGGDRDGDALCDDWETGGIDYDGDGTVDLALNSSPFNANMNHKDLFAEIDWMDCNQGGCVMFDTHNHQPLAGTLTDVTNAFAAAPITNPDGLGGITLHLMSDEAVREIEPVLFLTRGAGATDDFDDIKAGNPANPCGAGASDGHFGTSADRSSGNCANILGARRLSFRYTIFGHNWTPGIGSAGVAELPGNDFMVTLGGWNALAITTAGGQRVTEAGTLMHEMGHTLNLRHGGGSDANCKPNYLSIMSYALTYENMDSTRPLDYSRQLLNPLNESSLSEPAGIGGPAGRRTIYGTGGTAHWGTPTPGWTGTTTRTRST